MTHLLGHHKSKIYDFFLKKNVCVYVSACHKRAGAHRGQKMASDQFQVVASCSVCVLAIEPRLFERS